MFIRVFINCFGASCDIVIHEKRSEEFGKMNLDDFFNN